MGGAPSWLVHDQASRLAEALGIQKTTNRPPPSKPPSRKLTNKARSAWGPVLEEEALQTAEDPLRGHTHSASGSPPLHSTPPVGVLLTELPDNPNLPVVSSSTPDFWNTPITRGVQPTELSDNPDHFVAFHRPNFSGPPQAPHGGPPTALEDNLIFPWCSTH